MGRPVEVLLKDNILKLGSMGDIVKVKPGYARNYLLPQGKAVLASSAAKRQVEVLRERAAAAEQVAIKDAEGLKKELNGLTVEIAARVAHDTTLFGSVGARDIVEAVAKSGIKLLPNQVHVHENFKQLGSCSRSPLVCTSKSKPSSPSRSSMPIRMASRWKRP